MKIVYRKLPPLFLNAMDGGLSTPPHRPIAENSTFEMGHLEAPWTAL
jgi:hypothetical protein